MVTATFESQIINPYTNYSMGKWLFLMQREMSERAKRAVRRKQTSERCERTSERTSEWPITKFPISRRSESQWNVGKSPTSAAFFVFLISVGSMSRMYHGSSATPVKPPLVMMKYSLLYTRPSFKRLTVFRGTRAHWRSFCLGLVWIPFLDRVLSDILYSWTLL